MTLDEYLDFDLGRSWDWLTVNCSFFACDWVCAATGRDPAKGLRGRIRDEESARAVIQAEGGFLPMVRYRLDRLGFAEAAEPRDGDVGVVNAPVHFSAEQSDTAAELRLTLPVVGAVMAIYRGGLWVARAARGHRASAEFSQLAVWRVE